MASTVTQFDEAARLEALLRYQALDTPAEKLFDDIAMMAAQLCEVPIALISLVDDQRQWFKSKIGLDICETPREVAFCAHALFNPEEVFVVPDATADTRFADNPLVTGDPSVRFYAGAPLTTHDGHVLGALCVIDRRARSLSDKQLQWLQTLSRQVVAQLEAQRNFRLLREAAVTLEQQQKETQQILDHLPAYVYYKDGNNRLLRVNQAVADSLGLDIKEIEGELAGKFYPNRADVYHQEDLDVIQTRKPKFGIVEKYDTGGESRWTSTDKIPMADQDGRIDKILVVATDITNIKRMEESLRLSQSRLCELNEQLEERVERKTEQLRESQKRFEDLYQNAPDMYISVDPVTSRVLRCNQTLLVELGYSREEIVGQLVTKLHHPNSDGLESQIMHQFRTTGDIRNFELTLMRKNGDPIEVSLNVSAIRNEEGTIVASRSVFRDITEQKRLEEEASKMFHQLAHLARVATMNEIATGISHELNQPLHAIKNYAQGSLLRLSRGTLDSESLSGALNDIVANADRAAELIVSFRRFVKPSGKHTDSIAPAELIARVERFVEHQLQKLKLRLIVSVPSSLPSITCDSVQIEQVLINLVLNAAEAMAEEQGEDRQIQIQLQTTSHQTVMFDVVDEGIGLANADADRIFEAFYTTKSTGLGMGLPICRTIVETHGGKLIAIPNDGKGLTMRFELPASKSERHS